MPNSGTCQGFSRLGAGQGFGHAGTALFDEILRLVGELQPPLVFLENVPDIVWRGMDRIIEGLGRGCGYDLRWCVLGALHLGGPHARRRWFCIAARTGDPRVAALLASLEGQPAPVTAYWETTPAPTRMTLNYNLQVCHRLMALGNAVVPDCVRVALHMLATTPVALRPQHGKRMPPCGWWTTTSTVTLRWTLPRHFLRRKRDYALVFDPDAFVEPPRAVERKCVVPRAPRWTTPQRAARWTTPRRGMVRASYYLSLRSIADLPTQVRFEKGTPDDLRPGQMTAEFAEYLMGAWNGTQGKRVGVLESHSTRYPIGWTASGSNLPDAKPEESTGGQRNPPSSIEAVG